MVHNDLLLAVGLSNCNPDEMSSTSRQLFVLITVARQPEVNFVGLWKNLEGTHTELRCAAASPCSFGTVAAHLILLSI